MAPQWAEDERGTGIDGSSVSERSPAPGAALTPLLLAAVLSVEAADTGAIGALAPQLEGSLHLSNASLGLLVTAVALVGVVGTIPLGALVDRVNRQRLLVISLVAWGGGELLSSFSVSYSMLLVTRLALGAMLATAGPAVASLTGDLFPPRSRSRMYGVILTGEFLGAGAGVLIAGLVSNWFGWRPALAALGLPSFAVAWLVSRHLKEPERGRQSASALASTSGSKARASVRRAVDAAGVEPRSEIVVRDPAHLSLKEAVVWVLKVRTNVVLIAASSLGFFFFAGLETFALLYLRGHYHLGQGVASALLVVIGGGAVGGVVLGGRLTDGWIRRGRVDARLLVPAAGFVVGAILIAPAMVTTSIILALPALVLAAAAVAMPNPGLDAARLDVVPALLWGRAEGVRTFFRQLLQALAPLTFGLVSAAFGGRRSGLGAGIGSSHAPVGAAQTHGLELTFLIMLVPMLGATAALVWGRRFYPADVASASRSDQLCEQARRPAGTSSASSEEAALAAVAASPGSARGKHDLPSAPR